MYRSPRTALLIVACTLPGWLLAQGRRGGTQTGAGGPDRHDPSQSAPARTSGTVSGQVTANGAHGETIDAANVLVQLWSLDEATSAAREASCAAWLADKPAWLQARQEVEYPSGLDLAGTTVGNDVAVIRTLMALRRDTVRSDAKGNFTFNHVRFGAYTVEGEAVADDRFVQWSRDVAVIPVMPATVSLDAGTLHENQFCNVAAPQADTAIAQASELDAQLRQISTGADMALLPSFRSSPGPIGMTFVVGPDGVPEVNTLRLTSGSVSALDAQTYVSSLRFTPPTAHGKPVRALAQLVLRITAQPVH